MMTLIRTLASLLLLGSFATSAELTIMTEDFPPYNYAKDGKVKGVCTSITQAVQKKINDQSPIILADWSKSYERVLKEDNLALFCTTRTEVREKLFKWVGPIAFSKLIFQESTLRPTHIKTLEDAKNVGAISVTENDSSHQYLKELGFSNFLMVEDANQLYQAVYDGKADLTTGNWLTLPLSLKQHYLPPGSLRNTNVKVYNKGMYIAFSKTTPDSVIATWQNALVKLKESGEYNNIRLKAIDDAYTDYDAW